ncbi:DUF1385 domain-containing protein [Alkaliphilus pronyensis]|uniref:DUF1385 domain-containing protein n=1 Tax=Alkaliphilus pronyensis TaxID=1482732 RepID=A0A6I0F931_9FIRM|nr:DUF1385 domain-containing protein [Alkaliphilus pronyensis]KAB3535313.1 DUF1385 domain-containing protein [Alkaliphilus pronyensis]
MKVGGLAHRNGVTFFSDAFKIKAIKKNNKIDYKIKWILPPSWFKKIRIRPVFTIINTIYYQFMVFDTKIKLLLALILLLYFIEPFIPIKYNPQYYLNPLEAMGVVIAIIVIFHRPIIKTLKFHGAEHKVINCYISYGYVSEELVKKSSRFNKRCGTNLAVIFLILYGISTVFAAESIIIVVFAFFISIIISKALTKLKGKRTNSIVNAFQWITVWEPSEEEIYIATQAFLKLYKSYNIYCREMRKANIDVL